jgi:hypothetical protein
VAGLSSTAPLPPHPDMKLSVLVLSFGGGGYVVPQFSCLKVAAWRGALPAAARLEGGGAIATGGWAPPHLTLGGDGWQHLCR